MFTVKLVRADQDTESWVNISCARYDIHRHPGEPARLVCHEHLYGSTPSEFMIGTEPGMFDACFIENAAAKTIDKHRARPLE